MIQVTPQMRILVAVAPADFRRGIDGVARVCREVLERESHPLKHNAFSRRTEI